MEFNNNLILLVIPVIIGVVILAVHRFSKPR